MSYRYLWIVLLLPLSAFAETNTVLAWLEKVKLSADFRYRHELIAAERAGTDALGNPVALQNPDRNRHRIRARLGVVVAVNSQWDIVTRLATSTASSGGVYGDQVSTNQDLTAGSAPKPFWLDRAYVDFHPNQGLAFRAGRFAVPYEGTDLLWDSDLNLEGGAITALSRKFANCQLFGRAGGYWVWERTTGPDQGLLGVQGGAKYAGDVLGGQLALGYYDYTNLRNGPVVHGAFGNTVANGVYINDYDLLNVNGQLKLARERWEGTLVGDFVMNIGTEEDTSATGFLAGFVLGFKALPIDWDLGYNYRVVEHDAVLGAFNDSDSRGGGTNFSGHRLSAFFTVMKNTRVGANYFMNTIDPDGAELEYNRLQIDLEAKF